MSVENWGRLISTMDAPDDDQDIRVQKASADLLADLEGSLEDFLWKKSASGKAQIRRMVRVKEGDRLVALMEPFQELPQLLDPHLDKLVPILANAFLTFLRSKRSPTTNQTNLLMPLSRGICRLLYTLCKIRGEKVIVRFLSTETRNLELLLSAIEEGDGCVTNVGPWEWEERYITLLWLSQLLLVPFDLSTISSVSAITTQPTIIGLTWPSNVPGVTYRVILLAIRYLSSSGKERDAAKILLVRVAMRKDMQELGILQALVQWANSRLQTSSQEISSYYYIGILSFLAGVLNSSIQTADMDRYLSPISRTLQTESFIQTIGSSVVARKTSIKAMRSICVLLLHQRNNTAEMVEVIENTIGFLFGSLADNATPVRLAASKALSVITQELAPEMAGQVVEEVLASLKRNVLPGSHGSDLSTVNPSEWHGLILTLSQLLYRRSPPPASLSDILPALLTGLSFEQRSTSGSSIGTNVRDAACFGIWALARRYTTDELQNIDASLSNTHDTVHESSTIQTLATALIISSTVDPAGNIRRGSSAALQELVGRHPNAVTEGIPLVRVIDYHAVALRSRAIKEVALQAAQLSGSYKRAILEALLGWRGIGDADAATRRIVAAAFGYLISSATISSASFDPTLTLESRLRRLTVRQDDERHGLILCVASVFHHYRNDYAGDTKTLLSSRSLILYILSDAQSSHRRPDLIAEAVSRLILVATSASYANETLLNGSLLNIAVDLLSKWLQRSEAEVIEAASDAASNILHLLDSNRQNVLIQSWMDLISKSQAGGRTGQDRGVLSVIFKSFPIVQSMQDPIIKTLHVRWNASHDIETRAAILRYLTISDALKSHANDFADMISAGLDDYMTNARGDVGSLVRIEAINAAGAVWKGIASNNLESKNFVKLYGKGLRLAAEKLDKVRATAQQAVASFLNSTKFQETHNSSQEYFRYLLDMQTTNSMASGFTYRPEWGLEMLEGYVGSADTGSEELVRASRAAVADYCEAGNLDLICENLLAVLRKNVDNDRILVSTLEMINFLFDVRMIQHSSISFKSLYFLTQKAHYKTSNVRKLEAAVHLYGGLLEVYPNALDKLTTMLLHPFPTIRNQVADTLWAVKGVGKGVDWGKANKSNLAKVKQQMET